MSVPPVSVCASCTDTVLCLWQLSWHWCWRGWHCQRSPPSCGPVRRPTKIHTNLGSFEESSHFEFCLSFSDMIILMESGDAEQLIWTAKDRSGMRAWVRTFLVWWRTSPAGMGAHGILQNIGTSWSLNAICMALYIGDSAQATEIARKDLRWRVSLAINAEGQVWRELDHNAGSYSYVIGHIKELLDIAAVGDRTAFGVDLWWETHVSRTTAACRLLLLFLPLPPLLRATSADVSGAGISGGTAASTITLSAQSRWPWSGWRRSAATTAVA